MIYEDLVNKYPNKDMRIVSMIPINDRKILLATSNMIFEIEDQSKIRPFEFDYKENS